MNWLVCGTRWHKWNLRSVGETKVFLFCSFSWQEVSGSDYNAEKCLVACCFFAQDIGQYLCSRHPLLEGQICVGNKVSSQTSNSKNLTKLWLHKAAKRYVLRREKTAHWLEQRRYDYSVVVMFLLLQTCRNGVCGDHIWNWTTGYSKHVACPFSKGCSPAKLFYSPRMICNAVVTG